MRFGPFNSQLSLHMKWVTKTLRKRVFHTKNNLKNFEKHGWYKSLPKANKKNKNLFGLIHIWLSTHTSHLNMYSHTNEIGIHWTLNLCVVCEYQMWNSPKSRVKFQWSIQSSHTQLVLSQVIYLNYRNEHIWPSTKMITKFRSFSFGFCIIHDIWSFLDNTSLFEIGAWNFWYFNIVI